MELVKTSFKRVVGFDDVLKPTGPRNTKGKADLRAMVAVKPTKNWPLEEGGRQDLELM